MVLFFILITTEVLTMIVIRHHFYDKSWMKYFFIIILNTVLSIWLWILWFKVISYKGIFDTAEHIWDITNLAGMICAVVVPRILLIIFHFAGWFSGRKQGVHRQGAYKCRIYNICYNIPGNCHRNTDHQV